MSLKFLSRWMLVATLFFSSVIPAGAGDEQATSRMAPQFELHSVEHKINRLTDFKGRIVVVNFLASWCAPCRAELPSMNRAAKILRDQPVTWLAINVGEERAAVEAFLIDYPIEFTVLLDVDGGVSKNWRVSGMPTSFVINGSGEMAHRIVGKREWDDADHLQMLRELLDTDPANQ